MNADHLLTAVLALRKARRVVFFTGAGVSAQSGVPTFRDQDGFWQRFPPEQFANWSGLLQTAITDLRKVVEFVFHVVQPIAVAQPNDAHRAIAAMERRLPVAVVTQNIDGLHQAAGSSVVHEIHGSLWELVDSATGQLVHRFTKDELVTIAQILESYANHQSSLLEMAAALRRVYPFDLFGSHRPNLVLFGDSLADPAWTNAQQAVVDCDVMISIGTSGLVYPAAELPVRAGAQGATVISIDPQPQPGCWLEGPAAGVLSQLLQSAWGETPIG